MDQTQLIDCLITNGADWIRDQRNIYDSSASGFPANVKAHLQPYFGDTILDKAKVIQIPTLKNPPFYENLAQYGISIPLDFSSMLGITLNDTIVLAHSPLENANLGQLIFHELVHVTQYHFLGIDEFMKQYVNGWALNEFDYYSIPLEVEAYTMDQRYVSGDQFSAYEALRTKYSID